MLVKDVMTKNVISIGPDEHLSKALSKMQKYRINQLPVMSNGALYGMLELKKIVSRDLDITTTKASSLATSVPRIDANASVESAVELLLSSGLHAIPVTEAGSVVGIVSETDLMSVAKQFVKGLNQYAREIVTPAEYVTKNDNYGKLRRLMFEKNISRVPIVDGNRILGVVSTMEMIKILKGKERMDARGGLLQEQGATEKLRLDVTEVSAVMRPAVVIAGEKMISEVIDLLRENEEVIVQTDEMFGVITPKDILELFASVSKKQLYVQITGMHDESVEFQVKMDQALSEFVKKMGRITENIEYLVVHVEKMHKQGARQKYSIRTRFKAPIGFFVAHSWGWRPLDVIQDVFKNLEREVVRKHEKSEDVRRMKRQKMRYK
jgi:predicted transcriptional regulator